MPGLVILAVSTWLSVGQAVAQDSVRLHPLSDFGENFGDSILENLHFFAGSGAATATMVLSGTDSSLQATFQLENPLGQEVARATLIVGNFSTLAVALGLYGTGLALDDDHLVNGGAAAVQAVLINFFVTTALKVLSDRPGPMRHGAPHSVRAPAWLARSDDPADFDLDPFAFNGGLFWPSGHTSSHFALASALVAFYPDEDWLPWVAYPISAFVGVAMIDGDFHWASDVVAGGIIGHAIGWTIGKNFLRRHEAGRDGETVSAADQRLQQRRLAPPRPIATPVVLAVGFAF